MSAAPLTYPQFPVWTFNAPNEYIGASSVAAPCNPGDIITFTATIQYLSGGMQPIIGVWFWDITQTISYGTLQISPPNTDNGMHIYTFTVAVPAGAALFTVQTECIYLYTQEPVNAQLDQSIFGNPLGNQTTVPVNNTTNMFVGQTVTMTVPPNSGSNFPPTNVVILSINTGVSFNAVIPEGFWPAYTTVTNSTPPGSCYFVGFVPQGVPVGSIASQTQWAVSNYRLTQNGDPVYLPLSIFSGSLTSYGQTQQFVPPLYYLSLITSEYQQAPNFYAWNAAKLAPIIDLQCCTAQMYEAFNLATAQGNQLDFIGAIVGASRTLPFQPGVNTTTTEAVGAIGSQTVTVAALQFNGSTSTTGMYVGLELAIGGANAENVTITAFVPGISFTAVFAYTHISGVTVESAFPPSAVLDDADYLTLIQAKIAKNQWDGVVGQIYALLNLLFPGNGILLEDGGLTGSVMTMTVLLPGGSLTPMQEQMIVNDLILPRAQAVEYIFEYATLPMFGFGTGNTAFVAGFGTGYFVG